MRKVIQWNENWRFTKGDLIETNIWDEVTLPHTWNAFDGQDGGNDYYQGIAWYKKSFTVDPEFKHVFIRFGAVNKYAEVWCNGKRVGEHSGGFSAFTFDLTPYLQEDSNEIMVKANNSNELPIYPRHADFTFFGGIYREVELICFDTECHFDVITYGTDAIFVIPDVTGKVTIDTYATGGESLYAEIYDVNGEIVAKSDVFELGSDHQLDQKITIEMILEEVHRWNGIGEAYLYEAKVYLSKDGIQDRVTTHFGFRDYRVSATDGFFLNDMPYHLHGVCRHQDREDMGWAITEKEHFEDMALIREIGANTVRLAHYQQAPFFYDLCDRNGMVVWAEIPFISIYDDNEEADNDLKRQMRELVLQNYNHPSICFWGIANEVGIGGESEKMYEILRELNQLTKELDPTRLTVIANVGMTKMSSPLFSIADVAAYNEYKGWYEGTMHDHGSFCDERHNERPEIPLAISEYGAESVLKWHSEYPKIKDYSEEYQALLHEKAYEAFVARPYIWATWLWNMFDFGADARNEGGSKGRNNKGLVTYDRKIKKQGFYYYKACWSKEPFVYLSGERFTKHAQDKINIKVYSNQEQVELIVNGRFIRKLKSKAVFEFEAIELSDGYNEIMVRTPNGLEDTLILEKVETVPEEYVLIEEKNVSDAVTQWFANLQSSKDNEQSNREIKVIEGYLSVYDSTEEIYKYPEGFQVLQELIAAPLAVDNPSMAGRMSKGGALSFASIWNHISKMLPDELLYLVNECLITIKKKEDI